MRIVLFLIMSLCLVSCEKQSKIVISDNIKTFLQFPKEEKIEFKNLVEFTFGNPRKMTTIDSTLILGNHASGQEYYLHNYSLNTNKFSKPYLAKGRGPGEIVGMGAIGFYDNYLWINDFTGKKIMLLDKDKIISESSAIDYIEYSFKKNRYYCINLIDNLQCIGTGSESSKFKIQIIDLPTGEIKEEFGELKSHSKDLPSNVFTMASLTQSFLKPTKDKLVLGYVYTDIIEIFDLNTKKSISLQGPEKFDSHFKIHKNKWVENDQTRVAFIGGTTTNKNIYLLYSGKSFNEEKSFRGKYIYVYDWDMNPIKKITLDKEVYQISISEDDKILYSFDELTGYVVSANIK